MKIKKLKKLSIFLFIFTFTLSYASTSFAAMGGYDASEANVEQNLSLSVSPFFKIEKASGSNMNASVRVASDTSLEITTPISVNYNVNTNDSGTISITATAPTTTGTVNALFGSAANSMKIVFTKSDSSATSSAVTDASSSNAATSSNTNAIAFTFTPQTPSATLGTAPTISVSDNTLLYSFDEGSFDLPLKIEGSSLSGTYSANSDAAGEYKATLIVSKVDV